MYSGLLHNQAAVEFEENTSQFVQSLTMLVWVIIRLEHFRIRFIILRASVAIEKTSSNRYGR